MFTHISFPGLGIGEFVLNRHAFSLFGRPVYWYGIIIVCGIIAAFVYASKRAKQEGVKFDDLLDITLFTVIFAIVGARVFYVLTTVGKDGYDYSSFKKVIAVWEGGIAIYGAIIAGAITVFVVCRIKKLNFRKVTDFVAPGVMLGQIIGRWGNFVNGEAHGGETDIFCRMGLFENATADFNNINLIANYYHPTFLYESLWNLIGFVLINIFYKKKKFHGEVLCWYVGWYGFGRCFIEMLRTDSLYIGNIRISSLIGILSFVAALGIVIYMRIKLKDAKPVFVDMSKVSATAENAENEENPEKEEIPENSENTPDTENIGLKTYDKNDEDI